MLAPHPPESFLKGLERDFGGAMRLRWSPIRNRWQIERKGREVSKVVDPNDRWDTWIRVKDGFYRVAETSPGSLVCCSHCAFDFQTEIYSLKAPRCPKCERQELVMNWPLGEKLLERLRFTDPDRDGLERMWKDLEKSELEAKVSSEREKKTFSEAVWKEDFNQIFEIQSKGYTGKEASWVDAPDSKRFGGNL